MAHKWVYAFSEGAADMRALLGGKGAGLAEMTRLGVPVPDGFTITTEACVATSRAGGQWPDGLAEQVDEALAEFEERTGLTLGDASKPLLVSVRSGAAFSMPGMMESILNLGLNEDTVQGLATASGNERFAYDAYRRLLQMFGDVVEGVEAQLFEDALTEAKRSRGVKDDVDLDVDDLKQLVEVFQRIYREHAGHPFPQDPREQLRLSIDAVFRSWDAPRAKVYRRANDISDDLGTAVNICQMVFGNLGDDSGTGVCFSRDPATGEKVLYGEFLRNAQGEDVVSGIRTPEPIARMQEEMPEAYDQLVETVNRLEEHYKDVQDIEFTVERGTLYLLQTRSGKRTAAAAVKIVRDLVAEGVIDEDEAVRRIDPRQLDQLLHPRLDPKASYEVLARGLNASPGAAVGEAVFDADTAKERGAAGDAVILVRWETTPDDIHGLIEAQGVVTAHGGMTSHAAVVARGMGKPCVAGVEGAQIDARSKTMTIGDTVVKEGDVLTIDGTTGDVILGAVPLVAAQLGDDFAAIGEWADGRRRLGVRANADTPEDAARAREFGAEGIGLCRTEHMFMARERLPVVREMILADDDQGRAKALEQLLPMQQQDFAGIFKAMGSLPVTIRLLDPPLHEFLPDRIELATRLATTEGEEHLRLERLDARVRSLSEQNPMLGTRGCRLGLVLPRDLRDAGAGHRPRRPRGGEGRRGPRGRDHDPAGGLRRGARPHAPARRGDRRGGARGRRRRAAVPDRHDDRAAAGRPARRRARRVGPVLLVRHQRPDPDRARLLARRRRGPLPVDLPRGRGDRAQPVPDDRPGGRRRARRARRRAGAGGAAGHQARHLRRARRRPGLGRVLPPGRPRLRLLLAVPGAAGAARGGPGGAGREGAGALPRPLGGQARSRRGPAGSRP